MQIYWIALGVLVLFFIIPLLVILIGILFFAIWGVLDGFYIPIIKWIIKHAKT